MVFSKRIFQNTHELKLVLKSRIKQFNLDEEKVLEAIDIKLKGIENLKNEVVDDEEEYRFRNIIL